MRRKLSLRGRMVMTAVAATAVSLVLLLVLAGPRLESRAREDAYTSLTAEARLMARVVEDALARGVPDRDLDAAVDAAAREVDARVTIMTPDGRVLSRQALLERVGGYSYAEGTRTVDVHVRRLREKLPAIAARLITVKSLGYRFAREGSV